MNNSAKYSTIFIVFLLCFIACKNQATENVAIEKTKNTTLAPDIVVTDSFVSYTFSPEQEELHLYWKDKNDIILKKFSNLKGLLTQQNKELLFAMNAGMYMQDNSPLGLYIENGKTIRPLNTKKGSGNFYLRPNGVFYIKNDHSTGIAETGNFKNNNIKYATQSGPMLVVNGKINPVFSIKSGNLNIRNGVGIAPDNRPVFLLSKIPVSFYTFAAQFQKLGCHNALFLDGAISDIYLKNIKDENTLNSFGVMIGVTKK